MHAPSDETSVPAANGAAVTTLTQSHHSKAIDSNRAAVANRASGLVEAGSKGRRDNQRKPFRFDRTAAVTDVVKELLPLAQAGDTEVMYELGFRLSTCRDHLDGDEASVRRKALRDFFEQNGHEPQTDDELSLVAMVIDVNITMLDSCRGLDPALIATSVDWMERAAHAGDIDALLWYPSSALDDMRSRNDLLIHLDEVAHRRQLARSFLKKALDRGACDALLILSAAYSARGGDYGALYWLYPADPYLSLVYAEAAVRAGIVPGVSPQTLAGVADPARQAAAAAQGALIGARRCNTPWY